MTRSIDERVVQMAFENSQFERNVGTSLSTLDKLKRSLNFGNASKSFDGITNGAKNVNLNPISQGIDAVSNRFSALGIAGIATIFRLTNAAIDFGKKIATTFFIDPVAAGFSEFELKMGSIQTIMAGTGEDLATVNKYLNDLNTYSDKTIYSFADMTTNIGKFTNAGVGLKEAVAAIQGIANAAALSGSNAGEASRAMYNFAQAISAGHVKLIDWKSIELANMATREFKQQIIDTAVEIGTLTQAGDEYRTASGTMLTATKGFNDSLQDQWFTTDVLTTVLQKYSDTTTDIGKRATAAAQDVKTFSMMVDTLKEAAQSGWAQTWELIIGNFEEGKELFTGLNNFFGAIIDGTSDARNELLQGWNDLGGRTKLIESFFNVLKAISDAVRPISQAMKEIFPPITAQRLFQLTDGLAKFTKSLIVSAKSANTIKRIFRGIFSVFDIVKMAVSAVGREFKRLVSVLFPTTEGLTSLLGAAGDWLFMVRNLIKDNDVFGKVMRTIGDAILTVVGAIAAFVNKFKELNATEGFMKAVQGSFQEFFSFFKTLDLSILKGFVERIAARFAPLAGLGEIIKNSLSSAVKETNPFREKLVKIATNIKEAISKFVLSVLDKLSKIDFSNFDFKNIFDSINAGLLGALLISITRFVNKGSGIFGSITGIFESISEFGQNAAGILAGISTVLTGVKDIFTAWQQQIRAGILLKIAGAIAILAVSLIALSLVDSDKLTLALAAVTALFADLLASLAVYEKLSGGTVGIPAMAKAIGAMLGLSGAVLLLSVAMTKLAQIPSGELLKGTIAIGALMGILITTSLVMSKNQAGSIRGIGSLILFSIALRTLIGPLKTLGAMDTGSMIQGLIGLGVLLAQVSVFMKTMNFKATDLDDVFGLLVLSGAISVLSKVIEQLGKLDASTLTQGLTVLGILLTGIASFTRVAGGGGVFLLTAAGIAVLSGAMVVLADVLKTLGSMSVDQLTVALTGLGGALLILGIAMNAMNGAILGAGALLIAAAALAVLVPPLKALGAMSLEQVGVGLLALAGIFTVLGLAGLVLTPVVPTLLGLAVAVGLLGAATLAAGVGVLALATGLALLATVGAAGGGALAAVLLAIATVLPTLAVSAALAIISFAKVIKEGAPAIFEAGKALMLGFIKSVTETMPEIVDMVMVGIQTLLESMAKRAPEIVAAGYNLILGILKGVRDNIPQVVTVSYDLVNAYLRAIATKIPELIQSGFDLIISFIDGMTDAMDKNLPRIISSVQELGLAVAKGVVKGLISGQNTVKDGIGEIGKIIIDEFKRRLGIKSPSTIFMAMAVDIIKGLVLGLRNNAQSVVIEIVNIGKKLVENFKTNSTKMYQIGKDFVLGLIKGIRDSISLAVAAAQALTNSVLNAIRNAFGSQSPSRKMFEEGKYLDQGLAGGITAFGGMVVRATEKLGKDTIDGFTSIIAKITDAVGDNLEASPTIRPVVDLSAIEAGGSQIEDILNARRLNLSLAAIKASNISTPGQQAAQTLGQVGGASSVSFTQNNYSPKELSRVELYRQTRNLLIQAKGTVGAQ